MFRWLRDIKRCKDSQGNYCERGEYYNPEFGNVYFIEENTPSQLIENRFWKIGYAHLAENGNVVMRTEVFYNEDTQDCIRVGNSTLAEFMEKERKSIDKGEETGRRIGPVQAEKIAV